jgi:predicted SAM-dependent methyltransferase
MKLKSYLKERMSVGLWRAARDLRRELMIQKLHRKGRRSARKYADAKSLKLNIGCGENLKPGWVNVDLVKGVDLTLDMREAIPLSDGSAKTIYSEHFFEHLDYPTDAMRFLRECFRILEPHGIFSVGVPDTRWPLRDYGDNGDGGYFGATETHWRHPDWCKTKIEHINYHFRQDGEHRFAWDFETMEQALRNTGFVEIRQRPYRPEIDTETRALGTLYVDALRPPL